MELYKYLEELYLNNIPITLKSLVNTLYYSENVSSIETTRFLIKSDPDRVLLEHAYRLVLADIEVFKGHTDIVFYYYTNRVEFRIQKDNPNTENNINMQVKISNFKKYNKIKEEVSYE